MSEWKTIDSAPKDGTWMLGYYPNDRVAKVWTVMCEKEGDYETWYGDHHSITHGTEKEAPTHWMLLPEGPTNE
jgi:hypothetical protein